MILVDSSVWIDAFRNRRTPQTEQLRGLLGRVELAVGDLVVAEVLQGTASELDFERVRRRLADFVPIQISDGPIAIEAARNFRRLRALGITVRKTIDTLIATRCIVDGHALLYSDRDFDPFVEHLGLVPALPV
jgi:predicted nucleic acid-binding protein